ncbi:DUF3006 domain-containing protein [Haloarchaeobius litoreus]|uniref:DUF3006 domain-containing protein n=1 Tax=Haloarchaeobius litoreus TaxID=755306 RepID=A0ABD6DP54_9EURY|nr:DUF3006 domain-containing protein [Haloarchaeobius litoreus]
MSEEYTAVLDRFEDSTAVLLLEQDGEQVDELLLKRCLLPEQGRHQDAVFEVMVSDVEVSIRNRAEKSEGRKERSQSRFDQLSKESPSGDADEL